jgi:hypothetical protein
VPQNSFQFVSRMLRPLLIAYLFFIFASFLLSHFRINFFGYLHLFPLHASNVIELILYPISVLVSSKIQIIDGHEYFA